MRRLKATNGTRRRRWDRYPTPDDAVLVVRDWLIDHDGLIAHAPGPEQRWIDPAAGDGALIETMRDAPQIAEAHWTAIEIDAKRIESLERVAERVVHGDALSVPWTDDANCVMNPPFSALDAFWAKAVAHRDANRVWCAVLTPCAWWHAEKRAAYVRPDILLALGWRPTFHAKTGAAHKGSRDFCWAILRPIPTGKTTWLRVERPSSGTRLQGEARRCTCDRGWVHFQHPLRPPGVIMSSVPCALCNADGRRLLPDAETSAGSVVQIGGTADSTRVVTITAVSTGGKP